MGLGHDSETTHWSCWLTLPPGEGVTAGLCAPSLMQLVVLRSCLAFLTLSTVGAPSGAPALLKEAQWVGGHGLSSGLPTRLWPETWLCFWPSVGAFTEFLPESSALKFFSLEPPHLEVLHSRAAAAPRSACGRPHPDCVTFPSVGLSFHIGT